MDAVQFIYEVETWVAGKAGWEGMHTILLLHIHSVKKLLKIVFANSIEFEIST
jgi:hypothetical protein